MNRWFVPLCVVAVAAGCASRIDLTVPPDVRLGEDACDQCKMIINEVRFAAAYYEDEDRPRRFDDLGCLVDYLASHTAEPDRIWMHAYEGDTWLTATNATLVLSDQIHTAMGSGIVAIESPPAAERLAAEKQGRVVTLREMTSPQPDLSSEQSEDHRVGGPPAPAAAD